MTSPAASMNSTYRAPIDLDDLVSVEEAATIAGLSVATVRRMAADGRIGAKKIGDVWVVMRSSLPVIPDAAAIVLDIEQALYEATGLGQSRDGLAATVAQQIAKARLYDEAVSAYVAVAGGPLSTTLGYALSKFRGVRQIQPGGVALQLTSLRWNRTHSEPDGPRYACTNCGTTWEGPDVPTYCPNAACAEDEPEGREDCRAVVAGYTPQELAEAGIV